MSRILTLGEIMLRLSTEIGCRLDQAASFQGHYGGSEANVAIGLANFGHKTMFASIVPDQPLGLAAKYHLQKFGVNTSLLKLQGNRLGVYYLDTGIGMRAPIVLYDRAFSSFAMAEEIVWDMDELFYGIELFHLSGITPAISEFWQIWTVKLVQEAKRRQIKVSFDINYRTKLWSQKEAGGFLGKILPYVDYCSAGKLDAIYLLGIEESPSEQENPGYYFKQMQQLYPNIEIFYATTRNVISASENRLQGFLWKKETLYSSKVFSIPYIVDRVGGGDAFTAGILHGILEDFNPDHIVCFAASASSLKHTVLGDCSPFATNEVEQFLISENGKIIR